MGYKTVGLVTEYPSIRVRPLYVHVCLLNRENEMATECPLNRVNLNCD